MKAQFQLAAPKSVELELRVTAPLEEWLALRDDLRLIGPGARKSATGDFLRKLEGAIDHTSMQLANQYFTTGYRVDPVQEETQS